MKKEEFGKLWVEFQEFVKKYNTQSLRRAKGKTSIEQIRENIHTVGDGFDSFIAWCTGEYKEEEYQCR